MKILTAEQIRSIDELTIKNEPIPSVDLMERAALACMKRIIKLTSNTEKINIACGKGNNGGDGLAIARLLLENGFNCDAYVIHYSDTFSTDAETNYTRLKEKFPQRLHDINTIDQLKDSTFDRTQILIDAILGTGTNRPVEDFLEEAIQFLNTVFKKIISIDVPSGLYVDKTSKDNKNIIRSTLTLTFQFPKLAFLLAENKNVVPEFEIIDIGLNQQAIDHAPTVYHYVTADIISPLLKPRNKFSHKGDYGHALLMAGSKGKSGSAIIASLAAMRSGAGLLTLHSTKNTLTTLLHRLPEAMSDEDENADFITGIEKPEKYDAIGFGPGVGTHEDTQQTLKKLLNYYAGKLVIDADGLNILSENKTWLNFLPANTILTPHQKEFERLTEKSDDDFERLKTARHFAARHNCIVILKNAHSAIAMPDGTVFFNSSGNAGLAKAGSGDGLTGIITGLLSRGYNAPQAALIGTFVHGYAADLCLEKKSMESILITDVIDQLPKAFRKLEQG